ncbi:hypothetical protein E2C01_071794 [Portunus trituberculatus]|uniref:Uncharacterized protein n=1 Tax=Portunus trituberculatus TaxID=210409 RepID=A0A5B7I0V2_PORTR|nr:hypothetical protein [Portunus trituberculatus]
MSIPEAQKPPRTSITTYRRQLTGGGSHNDSIPCFEAARSFIRPRAAPPDYRSFVGRGSGELAALSQKV